MRFLLVSLHRYLENLISALRCFNGCGVPGIDLLTGGLILVCQCLYQRQLHYPFKVSEGMEVVGHAVVLDYSPILRLVLGHDAVSIVVEPLRQINGFAVAHILGALRLFDARRYPKADTTIDTALTAIVMLVVGMKNMDLIPQKLGDLLPRMGNERLFVAELQFQFVP